MVNPAYLCKQALLLTDETEKKRIITENIRGALKEASLVASHRQFYRYEHLVGQWINIVDDPSLYLDLIEHMHDGDVIRQLLKECDKRETYLSILAHAPYYYKISDLADENTITEQEWLFIAQNGSSNRHVTEAIKHLSLKYEGLLLLRAQSEFDNLIKEEARAQLYFLDPEKYEEYIWEGESYELMMEKIRSGKLKQRTLKQLCIRGVYGNSDKLITETLSRITDEDVLIELIKGEPHIEGRWDFRYGLRPGFKMLAEKLSHREDILMELLLEDGEDVWRLFSLMEEAVKYIHTPEFLLKIALKQDPYTLYLHQPRCLIAAKRLPSEYMPRLAKKSTSDKVQYYAIDRMKLEKKEAVKGKISEQTNQPDNGKSERDENSYKNTTEIS